MSTSRKLEYKVIESFAAEFIWEMKREEPTCFALLILGLKDQMTKWQKQASSELISSVFPKTKEAW